MGVVSELKTLRVDASPNGKKRPLIRFVLPNKR